MSERDREIREFQIQEIRSDSENGTITGYAAVFNQKAPIWGFEEEIQRGAFKKTINDGADVFAFWNHDPSVILGRRKNNTLDLKEDDHGLHVTINPPNTTQAQDIRELIKNGYVDKMSFGFEVIKQEWSKDEDGNDLRTIKEVKLHEVSAVPMPVYDGTTVTARGAQPEIPKEEQAEPVEDHSLEAEKGIKTDLLRARFNLKLKESEYNERPSNTF